MENTHLRTPVPQVQFSNKIMNIYRLCTAQINIYHVNKGTKNQSFETIILSLKRFRIFTYDVILMFDDYKSKESLGILGL